MKKPIIISCGLSAAISSLTLPFILVFVGNPLGAAISGLLGGFCGGWVLWIWIQRNSITSNKRLNSFLFYLIWVLGFSIGGFTSRLLISLGNKEIGLLGYLLLIFENILGYVVTGGICGLGLRLILVDLDVNNRYKGNFLWIKSFTIGGLISAVSEILIQAIYLMLIVVISLSFFNGSTYLSDLISRYFVAINGGLCGFLGGGIAGWFITKDDNQKSMS